MFFFIRQKTAYEMRIRDWSTDVCSSDLPDMAVGVAQVAAVHEAVILDRIDVGRTAMKGRGRNHRIDGVPVVERQGERDLARCRGLDGAVGEVPPFGMGQDHHEDGFGPEDRKSTRLNSSN